MKRFLPAILMRVLPALQPPAFMSDAGESVRKAWAAMSASVTAYLPTEMPPMPRLPNLTLPSFRLLQRPTISPPLGRFFSSLSTLIFAPGQIHGIAIYYQVATGDLICAPGAGPRVECVDLAAVPWSVAPELRLRANFPSSVAIRIAAPVARGTDRWQPAGASSIEFSLTATATPPVRGIDRAGPLASLRDLDRENWVDLAAQSTRVRAQRPPPCGVDIPA